MAFSIDGMRKSEEGFAVYEDPVRLKNLEAVFPNSGLLSDNVTDIFKNMGLKDLGVCCQVSKNWNRVASDLYFSRNTVFNKFAFHPAHWNTYCGEDTVAKEEFENAFKLLPNQIIEILKSPSLTLPGKWIMDTHMLVWIPETIKGKPLTIKSFGELLKEKPEFSNNQTGYRYIQDEILQQEGDKPVESCWVLMSTDVLPGSRNKDYTDQQAMIEGLNVNSQHRWRFPKVAEAIVCIAAVYLKSDQRLFSDEPWTFTRCQDRVEDLQIIVGGFASSGIRVDNNSYVSDYIGVAGLLEVS
jgi:hypothetical protein